VNNVRPIILVFRYLFWKGSFSEVVLALPGVNAGFTKGLQLMNKAAELKPEERRYLPKPSLDAKPPLPSSSPRPSAPQNAPKPEGGEEVPFRVIVEEYIAEHNLLFVPLGKAHEITRLPMFRVSPSIDGRGGVTVYILDDVVWAMPPGGSEADQFKPIGLEDLVLRSTKGKR
jgi:tuftelin-interacting protein 11